MESYFPTHLRIRVKTFKLKDVWRLTEDRSFDLAAIWHYKELKALCYVLEILGLLMGYCYHLWRCCSFVGYLCYCFQLNNTLSTSLSRVGF